MSPLLDVQQRLAQVGRIRMGETRETTRNGKTVKYPAKLDTFRLTSNDKARLEAAAVVYGGKVERWGEQEAWQLVTDSDNLEVGILPGQTLSQYWELWSGGGCKRRCDGQTELLSDSPCKCPADHAERREAAMQRTPTACKPHTRLSVMLTRVPGLGVWRLDSTGIYAAMELAGAASLLTAATIQGEVLPARLRLDQRKAIKDGKTSKYLVPVLEIDATIGEVMQITAPGHTPIQRELPGGPNVAEALEAAASEAKPRPRSGRAAAEIGPGPEVVREEPIPVNDGDDFDLEV